MLEVPVAREIVLRHAKPLPAEVAAVMSATLGQVTAVHVACDLDSPPFDKALMDGYAVRCTDCTSDNTELQVVEEIPAGAVPAKPVHAGEAARIFTGAMLPTGADAVVRQERTESSTERIRILDMQTEPGRFILRRGTEMTAGEVVLPSGSVLTPAAFGLLAAVGRTSIPAIPRPRVCIIATGNELVEPNRTPRPGQIRNTNGPMLVAQADQAGSLPRYLGIATDSEEVLRSYIYEGLTISNVLILAGGVSAGKLDLVPKVLAEMGVTIHFHQVRMKPGKPLLFGTKGDVLVFGLPGNPVSAYVGFELFVNPALRQMSGHHDVGPRTTMMPLHEPFTANNERPTFHPARRLSEGCVQGLPWFGSPDLRGILNSDALLVLPAGPVSYPAGTTVEVILTGNCN